MSTTTLVEQYVPLANKLAFQKKKSLPKFIDIEDLRSAAYLGLVEAANRFNPDLGVCFSTFAYPRINGAIIDYLRDQGWMKRGEAHHILSLDAPMADNEMCLLGETVAAKEEITDQEEVLEVISLNLDNQAKSVLKHYFIDELSMKEVGEKFGVTEGRISQLIKEYKNRIRADWSEEDLRMELAA
jgi:RNA polymerase sigma factor for flagellar operon FliA